jgi:hypothetical protein
MTLEKVNDLKKLNLEDKRRESITMIVVEYIKLKGYRGQYQNGVALISKSHIKTLEHNAHFPTLLNNPQSPIVLTVDFRILQGNHRRFLAEKHFKNGKISADQKVSVIRFLDPLTPEEEL